MINAFTRLGSARKPGHMVLVRLWTTAALLSAAIVTIPAGNASTAAGVPTACHAQDEALANFVTRAMPGPVATTSFQAEDGSPVSLPALAAKRGAVVNFWATWCAPCIREMPQLDALKRDLAEDGIPLIALSQDRGGLERVKPFYQKQGYKHLDIHLDPKGAFARSLKIRGLPTTILFDDQGREVVRVQGLAEWDAPNVAAFIRRCLKPSQIGTSG